MSVCSSAEIAEKKRIALERLAARKAQLQHGKEATASTTTTTAGQKIAPFPKSFYSSPPSSTKTSSASNKSDPKSQQTSAHEFLSTLKQSGFLNEAKTQTQKRPAESTSPLKSHLRPSPPKTVAPVFNKSSVSGKLQLISPQRFEVNLTGFNQQVVDVFKTIPSKNYDSTTRVWSFAVRDYNLLQRQVQPLKPTVVMGTIPKAVLNLCIMPVRQMDESCLASIEPKLADKLLPFQREGVCFAIAQHGRVMICDEMGLGKTYQALAIADFYRDDWPLLICTTASTRESWASHVRELLPSVPLHYVQVLTNQQQYFGDAKVLVTSYNMMERHGAQLQQHRFKFLIFDESHTLKNSKAKCTNVADRLASQANRIVLLSGTPALSRPVELYSQLNLIDRKFMNYAEYTSRYCDAKQTNFGWDANGQSNLEELNVVLRIKFMIRRIKADVLPEMAEKFRETVMLDPSLVWSSPDTEESLAGMGKQFSRSKGREREEMLLKYYARTAEVKKKAVCAYLKSLLKKKEKFIVFAHHRVMLDAISTMLTKINANFIRIDGSTKNETRAEYIDTFQKRENCKVAVLSLKACNSGITLTAAELIVFAELDWNPSTLAQAESRAHRIGQQKPVVCRYLMAAKTADDVIWNMLKAKQDVLNRAGIFSENLQQTTHVKAPELSQSICEYFSPLKKRKVDEHTSENEPKNSSTSDLSKELENIDDFFAESMGFSQMSNGNEKKPASTVCDVDLSKELANIDDIFKEDEDFFGDDDEAFKDLVY